MIFRKCENQDLNNDSDTGPGSSLSETDLLENIQLSNLKKVWCPKSEIC
jgi:hypothetical protein